MRYFKAYNLDEPYILDWSFSYLKLILSSEKMMH